MVSFWVRVSPDLANATLESATVKLSNESYAP
jgi:hypothetical protein